MKRELKELKILIENSGWVDLISTPIKFGSNKDLYLTLRVIELEDRFEFHARKLERTLVTSFLKAELYLMRHPQDAIDSITSKIQNELL